MGTLTRKSTGELKPKQELDKINNERSEANAQALFSIFNEGPNEFCRITICKRAKEAWGTSKVKLSKLKMLSSRFESLKM